jgi:hypothetical protein
VSVVQKKMNNKSRYRVQKSRALKIACIEEIEQIKTITASSTNLQVESNTTDDHYGKYIFRMKIEKLK